MSSNQTSSKFNTPNPPQHSSEPALERLTDRLTILNKEVSSPMWLSVSEAAKLGGITDKTVRRAIASGSLKFKIVKDRYLINLGTLIKFLHGNLKLKNKFKESGLGQYVEKWK